jgi:hypothetical protein
VEDIAMELLYLLAETEKALELGLGFDSFAG